MTQLPVVAEQWYKPYSFNNALEVGWTTMKRRYGMLLAIGVAYLVLVIVLNVVAGLMDQTIMGTANPSFAPVSSLAGLLVGAPLAVGLIYAGTRAARAEAVKLPDLFFGFSRYWVVVGIALMTWLIMVGLVVAIIVPAALIGGLIGMMGGAGAVLMLLLVPAMIAVFVAAVYLMVRLWFAGILALDPMGPRPGVIDALKLSWEITRERSLSLFLLSAFLLLVFVVSALLLVLPAIFFALPFALAVWGAAYALIAAETGVTPLEDVCANCGYPTPAGQTCPECGQGELATG